MKKTFLVSLISIISFMCFSQYQIVDIVTTGNDNFICTHSNKFWFRDYSISPVIKEYNPVNLNTYETQIIPLSEPGTQFFTDSLMVTQMSDFELYELYNNSFSNLIYNYGFYGITDADKLGSQYYFGVRDLELSRYDKLNDLYKSITLPEMCEQDRIYADDDSGIIYILARSASKILVFRYDNNSDLFSPTLETYAINNSTPKLNDITLAGDTIYFSTWNSSISSAVVYKIDGSLIVEVFRIPTSLLGNEECSDFEALLIGNDIYFLFISKLWGHSLLVKRSETATSVSEISKVNIYPNPAIDNITILSTNVISVDISDISGKLLKSETNKQINVSDLPKGIYLVKVTDINGIISTGKFIKK